MTRKLFFLLVAMAVLPRLGYGQDAKATSTAP